MEKFPTENPESSHPPSLVGMSLIIYSAMACVGLLILHYAHGQLGQRFAMTQSAGDWARLGLIATMGAGVLLILSYFFEEYIPSFEALKNAFARVLGPVSLPGAAFLSAASALGEEILFRGAIQPSLGLIATSILFGILHVGPSGALSSWSLWAVLSGLLLGWMSDATGTLWAPILCHFLVNLISMVRLRRQFVNHGKASTKDASFLKEP